MTEIAPPARPPRFARLRRGGPRAMLWQAAALVALLALGLWLVTNARAALDARGMTSGLDFLFVAAPFSLGEGFFTFTSGDTYLSAIGVGLGNTVMLSLVSMVTATLLGAAAGVAALSRNPLAAGLARGYVDIFRNTPQLVQIVFWYTFFTLMPAARDAWSILGVVFASNRGLTVPAPQDRATLALVFLALCAGGVLAFLLGRLARRRPADPLRPRRWTGPLLTGLILGPPLLVWLGRGAPLAWSVPSLGKFNFSGGATLSPEFLAIYFGLSFYIAAFIAEIVRGGVQSVDAGQVEAARTIGLSPGSIYRRIVAPQAFRVVIPPLAAQYVSLIKNSSLGVAVGYPDLFSVSNTALTYSGRTIEVLLVMAVIYLMLSVSVGLVATLFNRLVQIPGR
ncbi:ABC transporter permease subunit (plasmid) [Paroceanicella profunda]|uniref:ABC transporter permease subunit n=1 Tax=Paroceanicella profunda TaxID=2579971 RepID=A0A5B8G179_9RHOB|nr:ABC transporter permease subunit [Paroceanicella profunda]QDL94475.1 ABC transporter permease subunit [Paroceanicella profunda]